MPTPLQRRDLTDVPADLPRNPGEVLALNTVNGGWDDRKGALEAPADGPILMVASLLKSLVNFRIDLLSELVSTGRRVVATAPEPDGKWRDILVAHGVEYVPIPMARAGINPFGDMRYLMALAKLLRDVKPSVIIPYTAKPTIYSGLASRMTGFGAVYPLMTGFGYAFSDHERSLKQRMVRTLTIRLYREALRHAPRVFVYNRADGRDIEQHRMLTNMDRVVYIPGSGVNLKSFTARQLPAGDVQFLMIARLLKEKGVYEFIKAAEILRPKYPHARFRIIGPLDDNPTSLTSDELDSWIRKGVVEYGGVADDVRPWLEAATVFVLPTFYREGIPRTLLEALATGRPLITTDLDGCRETVVPGENGFLVEPRSAQSLADAMERFLTEIGLAARMAPKSRALAEERFDVDLVNRCILRHIGLA